MKCGIREDNARHWGYCKGYWGMSGSPIMHVAASMENLSESGYPCMQESHLDGNPKEEPPYAVPHIRWRERSVNTKVGDNTCD